MARHPVNSLHTTSPEDSPQLYLIRRIDLEGRLRVGLIDRSAQIACSLLGRSDRCDMPGIGNQWLALNLLIEMSVNVFAPIARPQQGMFVIQTHEVHHAASASQSQFRVSRDQLLLGSHCRKGWSPRSRCFELLPAGSELLLCSSDRLLFRPDNGFLLRADNRLLLLATGRVLFRSDGVLCAEHRLLQCSPGDNHTLRAVRPSSDEYDVLLLSDVHLSLSAFRRALPDRILLRSCGMRPIFRVTAQQLARVRCFGVSD
jgi:hypothetical protein